MSLTPGLLYLAASIACSVTVAAMLKLARGWRIDVRQAIAVNYAVAATCAGPCCDRRPTRCSRRARPG